MNQICCRLLTKGFVAVYMTLRATYLEYKARNNKHGLTYLLMKILSDVNALSMMIAPYKWHHNSCFYSVKVIEELHRMLNVLKTSDSVSVKIASMNGLRKTLSKAMSHHCKVLWTSGLLWASNGPMMSSQSSDYLANRHRDEVEKLQHSLKTLKDQHHEEVSHLKQQLALYEEKIRRLEDGSNILHPKSSPLSDLTFMKQPTNKQIGTYCNSSVSLKRKAADSDETPGYNRHTSVRITLKAKRKGLYYVHSIKT